MSKIRDELSPRGLCAQRPSLAPTLVARRAKFLQLIVAYFDSVRIAQARHSPRRFAARRSDKRVGSTEWSQIACANSGWSVRMAERAPRRHPGESPHEGATCCRSCSLTITFNERVRSRRTTVSVRNLEKLGHAGSRG